MTDLKNKRLLVTPTSFGSADPGLKKTLEESVGEVIYNTTGKPFKADALKAMVTDVDGYIAGVDEINATVMRAAGRLKVVSRYGTGVDRVDLAEATRRGIVVTNTPGANAVAVAELAIGLILVLARQICEADRSTRDGKWPRYTGFGLRAKTVGLVGLGAIGRAVASRLKNFDCRILAADPAVEPRDAEAIGVKLVDLDHVLTRSDVVSLHIPATASTNKLMNRDTLFRMKPGAFLVNTARGELIDEDALKEALETGHLGGAALDVFSEEPPGENHILLNCENLVVTPHMAARTDDAVNQMGSMALQNCLAVLRGERPANVVNPEVYLNKI